MDYIDAQIIPQRLAAENNRAMSISQTVSDRQQGILDKLKLDKNLLVDYKEVKQIARIRNPQFIGQDNAFSSLNLRHKFHHVNTPDIPEVISCILLELLPDGSEAGS